MRYAQRVKRAVIHLPLELLARLDHLVARLRAARPGRRFSRAGVARALLSTGLGVVESEGARFGGVVVAGGADRTRVLPASGTPHAPGPPRPPGSPETWTRAERLRAERPRAKTRG